MQDHVAGRELIEQRCRRRAGTARAIFAGLEMRVARPARRPWRSQMRGRSSRPAFSSGRGDGAERRPRGDLEGDGGGEPCDRRLQPLAFVVTPAEPSLPDRQREDRVFDEAAQPGASDALNSRAAGSSASGRSASTQTGQGAEQRAGQQQRRGGFTSGARERARTSTGLAPPARHRTHVA